MFANLMVALGLPQVLMFLWVSWFLLTLLSIGVPPVSDSPYVNCLSGIIDEVDYPVSADADPILRF